MFVASLFSGFEFDYEMEMNRICGIIGKSTGLESL